MKPIIGITVNYSYKGDSPYAEGIGAPGQEWQLLADDYITAVVRAGGVPLMLPVVRDNPELLKNMVDLVDGVLFSGGSDVDPQMYGQTTTGKTGGIIVERDEHEKFLVDYVVNHTSKPVLGVCRGIQIINAVMGGTLVQHVPDVANDHTLTMYPRTAVSHTVVVAEDSILSGIVGPGKLGVNSFHHMAVDACAPGLKVVARSEDGITEAIEFENQDDRFFLAVQWHPEMMSSVNQTQQSIIDHFVNACH